VRIIGIDPGLRSTGWGVIERQGNSFTYLASGTVKTSPGPLATRLLIIHTELVKTIEEYHPKMAAVEKIFVNIDRANSIKLVHARAMALLAPVQAGLEVSEYAPNSIKQAIVGKGHATKDQVNYMLKMQLKNFQDHGHDCTDALAIALTHSLCSRIQSLSSN